MEVNFVKFLLKAITMTVLVLFITLLVVGQMVETSRFYEFVSGYATSLFIFCFSILAIFLSQKRTLKTFLGLVIGGMFVRLLVFGLTVFLIYKYTRVDIHYYIGSFIIFYIIFQFYEIRLIHRTLIQGKR